MRTSFISLQGFGYSTTLHMSLPNLLISSFLHSTPFLSLSTDIYIHSSLSKWLSIKSSRYSKFVLAPFGTDTTCSNPHSIYVSASISPSTYRQYFCSPSLKASCAMLSMLYGTSLAPLTSLKSLFLVLYLTFVNSPST